MDYILITKNELTQAQINKQINHIKNIINKTGLFLHNHLASILSISINSISNKLPILAQQILNSLDFGDNIIKTDQLANQFNINVNKCRQQIVLLRKKGYVTTTTKNCNYIVTKLK